MNVLIPKNLAVSGEGNPSKPNRPQDPSVGSSLSEYFLK